MPELTAAAIISPPLSQAGRATARKGTGGVKSTYMDRFIDSIEWIAAIFVGVVAADVFITIFLRYFFNIQIPAATTSASCCSAS